VKKLYLCAQIKKTIEKYEETDTGFGLAAGWTEQRAGTKVFRLL
jgi:hypothetical protein